MSNGFRSLICVATMLCVHGCSIQGRSCPGKHKGVDWASIAKEDEITRWTCVRPMYDSFDAKRTLVIRGPLATVTVSMDDVIEHLEAESRAPLNEVAERLRSRYGNSEELDWRELSFEWSALKLVIANLLEEGRVLVHSAETGEVVTEFIVGEYHSDMGKSAAYGASGRICFLPDGRYFFMVQTAIY